MSIFSRTEKYDVKGGAFIYRMVCFMCWIEGLIGNESLTFIRVSFNENSLTIDTLSCRRP